MKKAKQSDYESVCAELGMRADIHFVEITPSGSISFTCGKDHECRLLAHNARQAGYSISKELREAAAR